MLTPARIFTTVALIVIAMAAGVSGLMTVGPWPAATVDVGRWTLATGLVLGYLLISGGAFFKHQRRSRPAQAIRDDRVRDDRVWVIYASQTGTAESIARQTSEQMQPKPTHLIPIDQLPLDRLVTGGKFLFVASTTGEGEPPDHAFDFLTDTMARHPDLSRVTYGVLALGDSSYDEYCAFGKQLNEWLQRCGSKPLFELIAVDDGDSQAIDHWKQMVQTLC